MRRGIRYAGLGVYPWLFGLVLGWYASTPARADGDHASHWIRSDAAIYIEVLQPPKLMDRVLGESFQQALSAIPDYAKFRESDKFREASGTLEGIAAKLDTTWDKGLRDLTGSGIVLAADGEPGTPGRVVLIVTPTDAGLLKRASEMLLDLARKDAESKGKPDPVKVGEHRGVTGYGIGDGAYAIVQDKLVIGNRPEAVKAVVDRALDGDKAGPSIAENTRWKQQRDRVGPDAVAWAFVRLDRLREIDPKKFAFQGDTPAPLTLLFGSWVEALRKADWASATLNWTESGLGAELSLPTPPGGYREALKGFVPPKGRGARATANPKGTIASVSLWRNLSKIWEEREDLFPPEVVQGFAKLDGVAGQFFGGRDFGTGVLGALNDDWRLVVAAQDYGAMKPVPDVKLPAFALIVDLDPDDDDFPQRLKVAFQSFVGLVNLGAAQSKAPPLELRDETVDGVTMTSARYMLPKVAPDPKEAVNQRHNFSPAIARVDGHFIIGSSIPLTRDLVRTLKAPAERGDATLLAEADGAGLAQLIDLNKERLVAQNMLEKGHDKVQAEKEVGLLAHLLRYLGHARLSVQDGADTLRVNLNLALSK